MTGEYGGKCERHGTPMVANPLTRPDRSQVGRLTLIICPTCENEAEDDFAAFLDRAINDRLDS